VSLPPPVHAFRATRADDAAIRALLRDLPSGGGLQLSLRGEPSFFDALEVEGTSSEVVAFAAVPGRTPIVGLGAMSFRTAYLNGRREPEPVGYLSSLRIAPEYRGGTLLRDGLDFLRARCPGRARLFLMSVLEDNAAAHRALAARAGFRSPGPLGAFVTLSYAVRGDPWRSRAPAAVEVRPVDAVALPEVETFWRAHGPRRQFFPVGTFAAWDQRPFRRWVVARYPRALGAVRPAVNALARLTGIPRLPPAGEPLDLRIGACLCVADDRPEVLAALLSAAWRRLCAGTLVSVGLHERDPLLPFAAAVRHRALRSRLYAAHWEDGAADFAALDDRVPHVELGAL
jgi:hypothetical protein